MNLGRCVFGRATGGPRKIMNFFDRRTGVQSRAKAPLELPVVHRLAEVASRSILQGLVPDDLVGICGNEDRRDRVPQFDQASVELNASHSRHVDVGDQAGGFRQEGRCQEIGCRRELFDGVAQQRYELSH
jgi:hypothetical protein